MIRLLEEISVEIGVRPSPWRYLLSDPSLAFQLFLGPCTPARYRLVGPGTWSGARHAVLNVMSDLTRTISAEGVSVQPAYVTFLRRVFLAWIGLVTCAILLLLLCLF